ncbi:MAG: prolyl oligopeptidase family serine peptidase [Proteobacteria bacterium]|nr:prolyl oligopeptidase family serine peptidase [Pseudomonadota bacterium]
MSRRIAFALWAVMLATRALGFDISSLLEVPHPSQVVSAEHAARIAWIANDRGVRNVWTAAAPKFVPQMVTRWTDDNGQDLSGLRMSVDGSTLVWVRGGSPDDAGFSQNPQSLPSGVEQEIWTAAADGPPRKLGTGSSPVLPPDARVVLVNKGKTISCLSVTSTAPGWCTDPLLKLRGSNGRPRFSPDGRKVAFVSDRKDHSFIGVLDTVTRSVTWIAPDVDRDDFPVWSPDGTRIAFIRIRGERFGELLDITEDRPFEIWTADATSGVGKVVFRSGERAGGFAQIDLEGPAREPLRWSKADQLLFYSEDSGWLHLYALSSGGGRPKDLTPGDCEVESDALAANGRTLIVSSNCANIDGRQLFRVSVDGGKTELLPGRTIDVEPVFIGASGQYAYRSSDAVQPISVAIAATEGRPHLIYPNLPRGFPAQSLVQPEVVTFQAGDGLTIHGQLFRPASGHDGDKRPAVIFVHGGPVRQMLPGWHYMDYYSNCYAMNQYLASRGFVVLAINYRSGTGYGQEFRDARNQGARGASEYQDVLAGREFLTRLHNVDTARIGIWGGSYGGLLTAQALARNSDLFAAGVDFHGVHDWAQMAKDTQGAGRGIEEPLYDLAHRSSPDAAIATWRSPVLFIHGDDDRSVPFNQTTDLVRRLRAQGVHTETLIFPDEEHGFLRYASWLRAFEATAQFLTRTLGTERLHDTIIRNGLIYDGSGRPPYLGEVAIDGDRIAAVGKHVKGHARLEVDARGKAVAPGFINMLSHSEVSLLADGRALSDLMQGVTLEVMGEDSMGPLTPAMKKLLREQQSTIHFDVDWTTFGEFFENLQKRGIAPNVAAFVGMGTVRANLLGEADVQPTPQQLTAMKELVRQAMEEGALGATTALIYSPDVYAKTPELKALAGESARCGGMYIAHIRSEGDRLLEAVAETIDIARASGAPAEIYHLKAAGKSNWKQLDGAIRMVEQARARGVRITADMYTYTAGATGLDAAMPPWVREGGIEAWVARLRDPVIRAKVIAEMRNPNPQWENLYFHAGPSGTRLLGFKNPALRPLIGKTLAEVAATRGVSPEDAAIDLVIEDGSEVSVAYFLMSEDNVRRQIALPWVSFGSDSDAPAPQGAFLEASDHPRAYGNFARLLARYVRDEKVITLQEAVRKLTALPAANLSLQNRGRLEAGYFADVVIFDPATIQDHSTYEQPHQLASGMQDVWVNGVRALQDGTATHAASGRFVRGRAWSGTPGGGCRASSKDWQWENEVLP